MHASEVTPEAIERANDLYWHSDRSVNQIAEQLDLSKGALYGVIEPEPSGLGCPLCGAEVGYPNRTAKEKGTLACGMCEWDGSADETVSYGRGSTYDPHAAHGSADGGLAPAEGVGEDFGDDDGSAFTHRFGARAAGLPDRVPPPPHIGPPVRTIAGGALVGAALGLALVLWARRR